MPIMTRLGKFLSSFGSRRRQGKKLESLCGMTTAAERQYLENYARRVYTGAGAIVDHRILPAGHGLSQADVTTTKTWLDQR